MHWADFFYECLSLCLSLYLCLSHSVSLCSPSQWHSVKGVSFYLSVKRKRLNFVKWYLRCIHDNLRVDFFYITSSKECTIKKCKWQYFYNALFHHIEMMIYQNLNAFILIVHLTFPFLYMLIFSKICNWWPPPSVQNNYWHHFYQFYTLITFSLAFITFCNNK